MYYKIHSNSDISVSELQFPLSHHISNCLTELQPVEDKMLEVVDVGGEILHL